MSKKSMQQQQEISCLFGGNTSYIEALYEQYLHNPYSVSLEWKQYFEKMAKGSQEVSHSPVKDYFLQLARQTKPVSYSATESLEAVKAVEVAELIHAYRSYGHYIAQLDPLNLAPTMNRAELTLSHYDLNQSDLERMFTIPDFYEGKSLSLKAIFEILKTVYTHTTGIEYMYIPHEAERLWVQNRFESAYGKAHFSPDQQQRILKKISDAETLEKYLGTRYVGQKRFSVEGGETLIPLLDMLIQRAGELYAVDEVTIGMAHRGRLNTLLNIIGMSSQSLFNAFEGKVSHTLSGDVKYHLGASADISTCNGSVHVNLAFNPSHLEIINPVVEGSVRARQDRYQDSEGAKVIPVLIHGDASFAGQGVVMETLALSQTDGYYTGGTVHIVLNNQVGFTTNPSDSRSSVYCTDVAKMIDAPVFHVNADDPEAAAYALQVALDYRMEFNKDVVIDLVCFRRHGHNEADEPSATQPGMYQVIRKHPGIRKLYADQLIHKGIIDAAKADAFIEEYRDALDAGKVLIDIAAHQSVVGEYINVWKGYLEQPWDLAVSTKMSLSALQKLCAALDNIPKNFVMQPQVAKVMEERRKMLKGEQPLNWGCAESLAFARLLTEGYAVRISGQDVERGTFAHRHAVLHQYETCALYTPLEHLAKDQAQFTIIDSVLSEEAVLGFEYGYALTDPKTLVVWEAQYGDFVNGAQVVIDQFISSCEQKWGRLCGLTMFLPHGYEGSGPEHSSARLERFLQLCAQHNIQVCIPTTPAQIFHLICRQMLRPYRKPLIVMTPKSLLRHKSVISSLEDLATNEFLSVISETENIPPKKTQKIILCSGRVYYDLVEKRAAEGCNDIAIIRIEQLYPFPKTQLVAALAPYQQATDVVWCQEEPKNQGAWYSIQHRLRDCLSEKQTLRYVGRPASASPAAGYMFRHVEQQNALLNEAIKSL